MSTPDVTGTCKMDFVSGGCFHCINNYQDFCISPESIICDPKQEQFHAYNALNEWEKKERKKENIYCNI